MSSSRNMALRPSQIVWLILILVTGVVVGIVAGPWWGVGAAVVVLAVSEVIERVQRARR